MSSTERFFIPHRQPKRLTPGEVAMGTTFEAKGVDPAPPPIPSGSLLTDNASAHGGREQQRANALAEAGVAQTEDEYEARIADLEAQLAQAQGGGAS